MVVRVVGAGLPRTGTTSLRDALGRLLGSPVYHMSEVVSRPEHAASWRSALAGDPPPWDVFLAGYAGGVDAPFSDCWRELAAAYPDAPVLLSHREDPEVWYRSMEATVLPRIRALAARDDHPLSALFRDLFADLLPDDAREAALARYHRRLEDVRREIDPRRLVLWQPRDGWGPLCRALDVPVPDEPFPHENSTADFLVRHPRD